MNADAPNPSHSCLHAVEFPILYYEISSYKSFIYKVYRPIISEISRQA